MASLKIGVFIYLLLLSFPTCAREAALEKQISEKYVTIQVGRGNPSAASLDIRPTRDKGSKTGFLIPEDLAQAALELKKALPSKLLQTVLENDGLSSDFYNRDKRLLDVSTWAYQSWGLESESSQLGAKLREKGFVTPEWMGRALFETVYEANHEPTPSVLQRLGRFAYVEEQDAMRPLSPPLEQCAPSKTFVQSKDVWLGRVKRWPYARVIYWVDCIDGSKLAYLWEKEWFVPDPELAHELDSHDTNLNDAFERCPFEREIWHNLDAPPEALKLVVERDSAKSASAKPLLRQRFWFAAQKGKDIGVCEAAPHLSSAEREHFSPECFSERSVYRQVDGVWARVPNMDRIIVCGDDAGE